MALSDSDSSDILNDIVVYLHRYIAPPLYIVGNIGNLLSVVIFLKKSWRKNVCAFYFLICLIIDLSYINFTMVISILTLGFNIHLENSNVILCKLFYYVSYLFSTLLPNIFVLASIDRLLISSQNIDTRLYSSKRLAYFSISISTVFWVIFYIHVLIRVNVYQINPSVFICYFETSGFYFEFISYSSLIIAVGLVVVLLILSMLTFKNVRRIRTVPHQQQHQIRSMHKKDFQLLRCLFVHDIIHTSLNVFLAIYYTYIAAMKGQTQTILHEKVDNFLNGFGIFNHHITYCISFFVFIIVSKAFRQEIKRLVYKIFSRNRTTIQEEENRQQNVGKDNAKLNIIVDVVSTIVLPA